METWGEWPQLFEVESEHAWEEKHLLERYRGVYVYVFVCGGEVFRGLLFIMSGNFYPVFKVNEMIRQIWEIGPFGNLSI